MRKRLTTSEFVKRAKASRGNEFDYTHSEYINRHTRIKVIHIKCGREMFVTYQSHVVEKRPCRFCLNKKEIKPVLRKNEDFVSKAKKIHKNSFNYSECEYTGCWEKVKLKCNKCDKYIWVVPVYHLSQKSGCLNCARKSAFNNERQTKEDFVKKAQKIHKNEFDYSLVDYKTARIKVKIKHKKCNRVVEITPDNHINKKIGCKFCSYKKTADKQRKTLREFIEKAKRIHGDKYDYSLAEYKTARLHIKIKCNQCENFFYQMPINHASKRNRNGCPYCYSSSSEKTISHWLKRHGAKSKEQKTFETCRNPKTGCKLRYDFYIAPDILIEYHGKQHFEFVKYLHKTKTNFKSLQKRDKIKENWAKSNNYQYHMIRYDENVIDRLEEIFKI